VAFVLQFFNHTDSWKDSFGGGSTCRKPLPTQNNIRANKTHTNLHRDHMGKRDLHRTGMIILKWILDMGLYA
jgi:hypothetical protein